MLTIDNQPRHRSANDFAVAFATDADGMPGSNYLDGRAPTMAAARMAAERRDRARANIVIRCR